MIQVKPNYLPAYNNLGSVCKEIGEFKQAIYYYYKAIEIKPDYMIMHETHQQQNHIFYEICKARKIKILMTTNSRSIIKKREILLKQLIT